MIVLKGTIENGQVRLTPPADLPDGTEVTVLTDGQSARLGIPDDQWPTDPDAIAALLARMDLREPLDMTAQEEAEIAAWRLKTREYSIAKQRDSHGGFDG